MNSRSIYPVPESRVAGLGSSEITQEHVRRVLNEITSPTWMNESLIHLLDLTHATCLPLWLLWGPQIGNRMTLSQRTAAKLKVKFELGEERESGFGWKGNFQNHDLCLFLLGLLGVTLS